VHFKRQEDRLDRQALCGLLFRQPAKGNGSEARKAELRVAIQGVGIPATHELDQIFKLGPLFGSKSVDKSQAPQPSGLFRRLLLYARRHLRTAVDTGPQPPLFPE